MVEDADLEAIEQHDTSRSIEIGSFVELADVDPVYFDRTYFLVPAGAEAARRPYVLLHEAMKKANVAALGRFVLAGKEKLCLIRPMGDALALETLFVHEDVKDHAEIDEAWSFTSSWTKSVSSASASPIGRIRQSFSFPARTKRPSAATSAFCIASWSSTYGRRAASAPAGTRKYVRS